MSTGDPVTGRDPLREVIDLKEAETLPAPKLTGRASGDWDALIRYALGLREDLMRLLAACTDSGVEEVKTSHDVVTVARKIRERRTAWERATRELERAQLVNQSQAALLGALTDAVGVPGERVSWADVEAIKRGREEERAELERLRELAGANLAEVDREEAEQVWADAWVEHRRALADLDTEEGREAAKLVPFAAGLVDVFFHLFSTRDGDAAYESLVFDQMIRVAELVYGIPCGCVEDGGEVRVCGRCHALARVKDEPAP